jgi:hypothetical protein
VADTTCSYSACALRIAPSWDGLGVVRGSTGQRVANLHFFWPMDVTDALRGPDASVAGADSAAGHARRALHLRRVGAGFTDAGALAIGVAILRAIGAGHVSKRDQVIAGVGLGAFAISVPLQFGADGELSKAVWWHNLRFARPPATPAVTLGGAAVTAPPPSPSLTGTWDVEYTLDSASTNAPAPTVRRVRGRLMFVTEGTAARGRFSVDFAPMFGAPLARDTAAGSVDTTTATEVFGALSGTDSVQVELIPSVAHGGLSMWGRIEGDSVSGAWAQRAYRCAARGHFRMARIDRTPLVVAPSPRD